MDRGNEMFIHADIESIGCFHLHHRELAFYFSVDVASQVVHIAVR
jgi:hypothetical protein